MGQLKSAKEVLEKMGFKKESPESTQFAFLRYLRNHAAEQRNESNEPQQLSFDLEEHGPKSGLPAQKIKKVSNPQSRRYHFGTS